MTAPANRLSVRDTVRKPGRPRGTRSPRSQDRIARRLGVSREHLNRVLNGNRISRSLLARYNEIIQAHHFHSDTATAA